MTGERQLGRALEEALVGPLTATVCLESLGVLVRRHRVDDTVTKAITRILRSDLVMVMVDDIGLAVGTDATVR